MKALISPLEPVATGYRVAEVAAAAFPVAKPLFWADCADSVTADAFFFDPSTQGIEQIPLPPEPEAPQQPAVGGAQTL